MGIFHIGINYIAFGAITVSSFQRTLLLMVVVLVGYLAIHIRFGQLNHGVKPAAVEAMTDGGTIIVSTVSLGDEVLLSVHDQGAGISGEVAKHVGKPFFTTKEASSGLGLAVCYSIASRHSARIEFVSTPNGTKFMVHFPMVSALSS